MAPTSKSLSAAFAYNPILNPAGGLNVSATTPSTLASLPSTVKPTPTPSLNTPAASSLSQLSSGPAITPTSPVNPGVASLGSRIQLTPSGTFVPNTTSPASAAGSSLSSVYAGTNTPTYSSVGPTGAADGSTGATGATGSTLPQSYYNADGTLMTPAQVAANIGSSLAAAHGNGDVGNLAADQFANPDGGTTADAQAAAANINNTENDISTGATDPYNVAGNSGIAYTPEELDAIQKAYGGVYTPALNTALAKVTLKQSEDKAALDQQNTLAQIDEQAKATVAAQANAPYTLGADEIRYDASGNPIAAGPESYQNALLNNGGTELAQYIRTTANGNKYVDLSTVTDPTENAALQNAARAQGIQPLTNDQSTKMQAIADTRTNLQNIQTQFDGIAGNGLETALGGFGALNTIESPFRSDIGSFQAWRTAAINSIQALAGGSGSGVRINQAEINSAMQNDIPNIGDSAAVGNAKIKVLNTQLDNWENELLNLPPGSTGASGATGSAPLSTPDGKQWTQNADGSYTEVTPGGGSSFNSVGNTTASNLSQAPEGNYSSLALNRPQRNNNPGDLKPGGIADRYANGITSQGDLTFSSPAVGFNAMTADVTAKINGDSKFLPANPTIAQLGSVYAKDPNWGAKVAGILGVPAGTHTKSIPIKNLVHAIATQEGFFDKNTIS